MNYLIIAKKYNIFDYPDNVRKRHKNPTPLLGGLLIFLNVILYVFQYFFFATKEHLIFTNDELIIFFTASTFFYFLGYFDDKYNLKPNYKLFFTSILVILIMYFDENLILKNIKFTFSNYQLNLGYFDNFFTVLCFLLFINAFNMLDGINGQASSYAIFILFVFALSKIELYFLLIPLMFFLIFNLKGKMFLGDSGTILIGFIFSYFFIKTHNSFELFFSDEIFLIMMIPGFELLRLAISRIIKKKHPFEPDNNHIHHNMKKKIDTKKSFLLIQLILIFPYALYLIFTSTILSFILGLIVYTFTIKLISR